MTITYNRSIAIDILCLAPVDEKTSSAAQQSDLLLGSDASHQSKRGDDPMLRMLRNILSVEHKQDTQVQWLVG